MRSEDELVVLLDDDGNAIGTALKHLVHHSETPLHRAFSAYLFDARGSILVTRRAEAKATFGGLWTNSLCGHPMPGESDNSAIMRRGRHELRLRVADPICVLPDYRYRAEFNGIVENEICPVYVGRFVDLPEPNPAEVCDWSLLTWTELRERQSADPSLWSPWSLDQARLLDESGALHKWT